MKAMIFAAGLGTRLRPLTDTTPKALVSLSGKTLLQYQIELLKAVGITEMVINIHHLGQQIIDYVAAHEQFGCQIHFSDERNQLLNTGGGLYKVLRDGQLPLDEPILAMNVDILSNIDIAALIAQYNPSDAGLLVVSDRQTQRYLRFDEDNYLCGWINVATGEIKGEKETVRNERRLAFSGMQILNPSRLWHSMQELSMVKSDFSLIDLYLTMPRHQLKAFVPAHYRMMDVGKINQLTEAEQFAQDIQANNR